VPPEFTGKQVVVRRPGEDITLRHAGRLVVAYLR
jgi:hypothetical protein